MITRIQSLELVPFVATIEPVVFTELNIDKNTAPGEVPKSPHTHVATRYAPISATVACAQLGNAFQMNTAAANIIANTATVLKIGAPTAIAKIADAMAIDTKTFTIRCCIADNEFH